MSMNWNQRHPYPRKEDYSTDEDYEEAVKYYEYAEDSYVDEYLEWKRSKE